MENSIILLRGVNVSGKNRLQMNKLNLMLSDSGYKLVKTYIQSGNIVLSSNSASDAETADQISRLIEKHFGLKVFSIVKKTTDFHRILKENPFLNQDGIDISKLHFSVFQDIIRDNAKLPDSGNNGPDRYVIKHDTAYVYCPDGYGRTKFNNTFFEKKLGLQTTTRNLRTMEILAEMAGR